MRLPKYLDINLSTGEIRPYPISQDYFSNFLGGKTLASRILLDETPQGFDPLGPQSVMIINTGPLSGTGVPASGRFNVTCKNVLTGGIASSNCGGNFGIKMRRAGIDGLVIRGQSKEPVYIELKGGKAIIHPAQDLWGLDTEKTQEKLPREYGKVVIGPAGENLVRYACMVSQERVAGRCGVGAVMGSKKLKAIIAFGVAEIAVDNSQGLDKVTKNWTQEIRNNVLTSEAMPRYGTMGFLNKGAALGLLPVKNFSQSSFAQAEEISGETYAENHLTRNYGCVGCPIRCGRRQKLNGKEVKGPEYETVGLLGSNLLNSSFKKIGNWNYQADLLGLDTISLGGTLGFAMELKEREIADLGVSYGNLENLHEVLEGIALRRGKGDELAQGSAWLAGKYGGQEFAPHSKGMEMAAYDPRRSVGLGLGYATSNRGACHLNGGYMVFLEALGPLNIDPQTPKSKAALTVLMQNLMEAISASGMCLFTSMSLFPNALHKLRPTGKVMGILAKVMGSSGKIVGALNKRPEILVLNTKMMPYPKALEYVTGVKMTPGRFLAFGARGYNLERIFNLREGLTKEDDALGKRMTQERQDPRVHDSVVPLDKMLPDYYHCRGWDQEGVPFPKTLARLGINDAKG